MNHIYLRHWSTTAFGYHERYKEFIDGRTILDIGEVRRGG